MNPLSSLDNLIPSGKQNMGRRDWLGPPSSGSLSSSMGLKVCSKSPRTACQYWYCVCRWGRCGGWDCCWLSCSRRAGQAPPSPPGCAAAQWSTPRYPSAARCARRPQSCSTATVGRGGRWGREAFWGRPTLTADVVENRVRRRAVYFFRRSWRRGIGPVRRRWSLRFCWGASGAVRRVQDSKPISILTGIVRMVQLGRKRESAGSMSTTPTDSAKRRPLDSCYYIICICGSELYHHYRIMIIQYYVNNTML